MKRRRHHRQRLSWWPNKRCRLICKNRARCHWCKPRSTPEHIDVVIVPTRAAFVGNDDRLSGWGGRELQRDVGRTRSTTKRFAGVLPGAQQPMLRPQVRAEQHCCRLITRALGGTEQRQLRPGKIDDQGVVRPARPLQFSRPEIFTLRATRHCSGSPTHQQAIRE